MKPTDDIQKYVEQSAVSTHPDKDDEVLSQMMTAFNQNQSQTVKPHPSVWRHIMKSRITKLAAAAAILIVVGLVAYQYNIPIGVTPAYAFEQTIEACHSVRYLHVRSFLADHNEPFMAWIESDNDGNIKNVRLHTPAWSEPSDGDKVIVWKDDKAHLWIKKKNMFAVLRDNSIAEMIFLMVQGFDPKTTILNLQQLESQGRMLLDIEEPEDKADPIIITATVTEEKASDDRVMTHTEREISKLITKLWKGSGEDISELVVFIDQATKLVTTIEFYEYRENQRHRAVVLEYYDYNQPINEDMFDLENEIPADVLRIDQTTNDIGLAQGNLTDKEIAVELIRQFLQALIDRDYAEAGRLFSGTPAERIEKTYSGIRFIRIISIGTPVLHAMTGGLFVPCTVEIEENGTITQWSPEHAYVRQVHGQPGRWEVIGGFRGI